MCKNVLSICILSILMCFSSCKNKNAKNSQKNSNEGIKTETTHTDTGKKSTIDSTQQTTNVDFAIQSVNDVLADKLKTYITTYFLSEGDLKAIPENERKFQLYQIDLNDDGKNEVFVNFMTSYFCGTGGCTILLLNNQLEPITTFTVTRTPLFAEHTTKNGWKILLTWSQNELKELVYKNGTYPSNPSTVEKAKYDAPSGHAEILFDDNYSKAKTYSF